ncbi:polymer biosynthesis protein, WecB/TagA/CpsF family [Succinivibrio dextrinosolvens]|uniref:WecB/TagA/CpsF family glycosyltransferase n=1 Tax=Succinivibrio dextrinosolvens TaxID=83771 RepID=UPI0008E1E113|nr:WecB/TagA/CpsF family glycosyltransferase [Succinivibrio dextrinosolvens]SFS91688.1 polymer biosynthesis protein, WecB/TagA/CpsF family [Succinivibrio dextrinosolvens]
MRMKFLNTHVDNLTMSEAIVETDRLIRERKHSYVVTPNMDHIVLIEKDEMFKKIYDKADLILTDGMPLLWIAKMLGTPIKEKISGADFFPEMCRMAEKEGYKIYILGAAEGVAVKAAENLKSKYEGLQIVGTYSPPIGFEKDEDAVESIIDRINASCADILAVALGSPKGEKFIYRIRDRINASLSISIGATIDFEAGNVRRAPKWMSNIGLEWFYRITQDPARLTKRYWKDAVSIIPIMKKYGKKAK